MMLFATFSHPHLLLTLNFKLDAALGIHRKPDCAPDGGNSDPSLTPSWDLELLPDGTSSTAALLLKCGVNLPVCAIDDDRATLTARPLFE